MSVKKVRTGDGLFTIELKAPKQIEAGGTIRFSAYFLHEKDGPVNPSGLVAKVYEGTQFATLLATLSPLQDQYGVGSYFAQYAVPSTQATGPLYVTWSGSYTATDDPASFPVQATQTFLVTNPSGKVY